MAVDVVGNPAAARSLVGLRPIFLLVGIATAVAIGVAAVMWSQGPTYNLLYGNLSNEDAAQMTQALNGAGIEYRLEANGAGIAVPADQVANARLLLAGQGLPAAGGFSSLTRDNGFGVSQFMEGARYHHALETELARTVASMQAVGGARVHIAAPRQSSFIRDREVPSASVFLQLRAGRRLTSEQITSITNLVASSVPDLSSDRVTVVDQQGRLLSAPKGNDEAAVREQQLDLARRIEEEYSQRIESLLAPLVGPGRVRAQVVAQLDMASTEEAREQYRPESQIVRSEQLSEEQSGSGANGARGVPGSLSNQPPEAGVAQPPAAGANLTGDAANGAGATAVAGGGNSNSARQSTRNFEIDRTVAYTRQPGGQLRRLTVAVLIDNARTTDKDGKSVETPLTAAQIERVTALVRDAVGFDQARGDSINIVNASWSGEPLLGAEEATEIPLWERPWLQQLVKVLAGLIIALVVIFLVIKPTLAQLLAPLKAANNAPALPPGTAGATASAGAVAAPGNVNAAISAGATGAPAIGGGNNLAYEQQIAQARNLVAQDPARVAQVVKGWVNADG